MANIKFPTDTSLVSPATDDLVLISDTSDGGNLKEATVASITSLWSVSWGNVNWTLSDQTDLQSALDAKMTKSVYDPANWSAQVAFDSAVVHNTGNETVAGTKTFSSDLVLSNASFDNSGVGNKLAVEMSSGLISWGVLSINADTTKFDLAAGTGQIVDYTTLTAPTINNVSWSAFTAQTVTNLATADITYILIDGSGNIVQQTTYPTATQRRDYIFVWRLNHSNRTTISFVNTVGDFNQGTSARLYDFIDAIWMFNISGNAISTNGANLTFQKSAGVMFSHNYNYSTTPKNPSSVSIASASPVTFAYRTQLGGTTGDVTNIDPTLYDNGGTLTTVPNAGNATIQRVFLFPSGNVRVQYGQTYYSSLAEAINSVNTDPFIQAEAIAGFSILIGYIIVTKNCTDLTNVNRALLLNAARFDSGSGWGSLATTTLQQAYNNSTTPEITTDSTLGAVSIKRWSAADTDNVLEVLNGAGTTTTAIDGNGKVTMSASLNQAKGADIASATTTDIGAATGNYVDVTGTTTITGLGTVQAWTQRIVRFTGALTLTHNATSLILPGGANITTAAWDVAHFVSLGSGNWRCTAYTKADGTAVVASAGWFGEAVCQDYLGQSTIGILGQYDATRAGTLAEVTLIAQSIPVGSNLTCELRKNSTTSGNVLSSTLQIATSDTLTNGQKVVSVTSFSSSSIADGDYFVAYLTSVGSTTPAINAKVIVRYT